MGTPTSSSRAGARQPALVCTACEKEALFPTGVAMDGGDPPSAVIHLQCGICGVCHDMIVEYNAQDYEGDTCYGVRMEQVR